MKRQSNVCCPASLNKFKFRKERCHSRFRSYKMRCRMVIISLMLTVFFGQHQLARAMPTERPVSTSDAPRALFVIHRHGERTLAATFSGDPLNNVTIWPDGLSQITLDGRRRMYRLGQFLHQKYEATIGENPKRVYVRSSGIDRCLESVQMVAHAMYPPKGRWNWNTAETWQPISVYTVYKPNDGVSDLLIGGKNTIKTKYKLTLNI